MRKRPPLTCIDPKDIYLHARGFYLIDNIISNLDFDKNPQLLSDASQPSMVLSALNSELFLKCLICLERGIVPTGHHLHDLFFELSEPTRDRIQKLWETEVVPIREPMWQKIEQHMGHKLHRDLPGALRDGSRSFEEIRYSYETKGKGARFYLSDLPRILGLTILEKKPEWEHLVRRVSEIPELPGSQQQLQE